MSIVWDQRIRHVDRPAKRRHWRHMARCLRDENRRKARGLPSRNIDAQLFIARVRLRLASTVDQTEDSEIARQCARLEFEVLRSRLLEHKREVLARVRARKVTVARTCINLWRRRREWLDHVNAEREAP
jgi:hypothetical protein